MTHDGVLMNPMIERVHSEFPKSTRLMASNRTAERPKNTNVSLGAAVRVGKGIYGPNTNHWDALSEAAESGAFLGITNFDELMNEMGDLGYDAFVSKYDVEDGFLTSSGDFLNRESALDYAKKIYELNIDPNKNWLNSEDIEWAPHKKASFDWYDIARTSMLRYSAKKKTLAVDFDETIAGKAEFPKMGRPLKGAQESLAEIKRRGIEIVIYTCRMNGHSRDEGKKHYEQTKSQIKEYLQKHKIPYDRIADWDEGKPFADWYLDDKAIHFDDWASAKKQILDS
jgi:hypothetical protein